MKTRRVVGMPKAACPRCGAKPIAKVQYGLPAFTEELEKDIEAGRIVLGGCVISAGQPDRACTTCGLEFRTDGRPVGDPNW